MTLPRDEGNEIPKFFRRQPRMRYHFPDDLRIAVFGGDDEALMRLAAHLQACPDCQERQFSLVEQLSAIAVASDEPGTIARATSVQAGDTGMLERGPGLVERGTPATAGEPFNIACAAARSRLLRYLEQDRELTVDVLRHLRTCEVCGAHITDAALTRYTIEMHGEEELPAIG